MQRWAPPRALISTQHLVSLGRWAQDSAVVDWLHLVAATAALVAAAYLLSAG